MRDVIEHFGILVVHSVMETTLPSSGICRPISSLARSRIAIAGAEDKVEDALSSIGGVEVAIVVGDCNAH